MTLDPKDTTREGKAIVSKSPKVINNELTLPSEDGINFAEFPLFPLNFKSNHLANTKYRYEWKHTAKDGKKMDFFFERKYGDPAPNQLAEDLILIFKYFSRQNDNPLHIPVSFNGIETVKGREYNISKPMQNNIVRQLDAMMDMLIDTNAIYSMEEEKWYGVKTHILQSYIYQNENGYEREKVFRKKNEQGEWEKVRSKGYIKELRMIKIAEDFYEHFMKESVPLNLALYFSLHFPTAKRIFRFGNKYVQLFGGHSLDLTTFCVYKIGMSEIYLSKKYANKKSIFKTKIKPFIDRVNETEIIKVTIEKSNTPSGYKIIFDKPTIQISLFGSQGKLTQSEKKALDCLTKEGIYPNARRPLIIQCRKIVGTKEVHAYVKFCIRWFKKADKQGKIKHQQRKGGVLHNVIKTGILLPAFYEWQAEQRKKQERDEYNTYGGGFKSTDGFTSVGQVIGTKNPTPGKQAVEEGTFNYATFQSEHAEIYQKIRITTVRKYEDFRKETGEAFLTSNNVDFESMVEDAIKIYCKQCFNEFLQGNGEFFPDI